MSPVQTYRSTCQHCGTLFFSPIKHATACPKCARKWGVKQKGSEIGVQGEKPVQSSDFSNRGSDVGLPNPVLGHPEPENPELHQSSPRQGPRPLSDELTEVSRTAILQEFEALRTGGARLRAIHRRLSRQFGIRRRRVAEVTQQRVCEEQQPTLSEEERKAVEEAYRGYVERGERPEGGRKAAIARELSLPRTAVERIVHELNQAAAVAGEGIGRETRFRIEQAYWRLLRDGATPLPAMWSVIAEQVGVEAWQAAWSIDRIHDDPRKLAMVEPVTPEQASVLVSGYEAYLAAPAPPEEPLHAALAARIGVTPRQAHRALLEYRWERRRLMARRGEGMKG